MAIPFGQEAGTLLNNFAHYFVTQAPPRTGWLPRWRVVVAALVLAGCVKEPPHGEIPQGVVQEQPAIGDTLPGWQVGDRWSYSDGYEAQVTELVGEVATLSHGGEAWTRRKGIHKIDSMHDGVRRQVVFHSQDPGELFPLAVGKRVEFVREYMSEGVTYAHRSSWTVLGLETIHVPAGKFPCWVLLWENVNPVTGWKGFEKWWYNPQVKHYVRLEYQYGESQVASRVLMSYALAP